MPIRAPLFVTESGDLVVYDSVHDARTGMEAVDVEDGRYSGYDAEGRSIRIRVLDGEIIIEPSELAPSHQNELEALIRTMLEKIGHSTAHIPKGDLAQLGTEAGVFREVVPSSMWRAVRSFVHDMFRAFRGTRPTASSRK